MIKKDERKEPKSCWNKAKDDEMVFVLLGRDPATPTAIRSWVLERIGRGKNHYTDPQIIEALKTAQELEDKNAQAK